MGKIEEVKKIPYSYVCSCGRKATVYHTDKEVSEICQLLDTEYQSEVERIFEEIEAELCESDSVNMWYLNKRFWQALKKQKGVGQGGKNES